MTERRSLVRMALTSLAVLVVLIAPETYVMAGLVAMWKTYCVVLVLYFFWSALLLGLHRALMYRTWWAQADRAALAASFGFVLPFFLMVVVPLTEPGVRLAVAALAVAEGLSSEQERVATALLGLRTYVAVLVGGTLLVLGLWRSVSHMRRLATHVLARSSSGIV